jgi:hypothetical protein
MHRRTASSAWLAVRDESSNSCELSEESKDRKGVVKRESMLRFGKRHTSDEARALRLKCEVVDVSRFAGQKNLNNVSC